MRRDFFKKMDAVAGERDLRRLRKPAPEQAGADAAYFHSAKEQSPSGRTD